MNQEQIVQKTVDFVKEKLSQESSGHDWWHVYRVWQNAIKIGAGEDVDMFVVQLAALLHDIADWKLHGGDITVGPKVSREFLEPFDMEQKTIEHVCDIVKNVSFKGAKVAAEELTKEGHVVQDADRLDALGAIGIARVFAYAGHKGREIYDPAVKPALHDSFDQYKNNTSPAINHFYEKLLLLKNLMNTDTGKKLAQERHTFMEKYLEKFYEEVGERERVA